jgi:hypothetical protein
MAAYLFNIPLDLTLKMSTRCKVKGDREKGRKGRGKQSGTK